MGYNVDGSSSDSNWTTRDAAGELSDREIQILASAAKGSANKPIAVQLVITLVHLRALRLKGSKQAVMPALS